MVDVFRLGLIVVLIVFVTINSQAIEARNKKLILDPQRGDVYEIKLRDNSYTLYKVADVIGDSAYLQYNDYETDKRSGLDQMKKKPYSEIQMGFSKTELKLMLDKGEILNINR